MPDAAQPAFRDLCIGLANYRPGQREAHAVRIIRSPAGQEFLAGFIGGALAAGAVPICVISEKRFCVCGKIVETFLDPFHNERAAWLPTGADVSRQWVANALLAGLPHTALATFAAAYREPTRASFAAAIRAVAAGCRGMGWRGLAASVEGNLDGLDELVEVERLPGIGGRHHIATAINVFTFTAFIVQANSIAASLGIPDADVVHDESREFRDALDGVFDTFRGASAEGSPYRMERRRAPLIGIKHLRNFEMRESHAEPCLQGADALATAVKQVSLAILRGEPPPAALRAVLRHLRRGFDHDSTYWIASQDFSVRWIREALAAA